MAATFSYLFIDDQYLRDNSPLGKNVDVDLIYPFVKQAQDIHIQDILGTPLYVDLEYRLFIGTTYSTPYFTSFEIDLIEISAKALAYWTCYLALPHLAFQIRNLGLGQATSTDTNSSSLEELKYIRNEMQNLGDFWNQRIVNFICANNEQFPLYDAASDDLYPNIVGWDSDIYIEDTYRDLTLEEIKFLKKYIS